MEHNVMIPVLYVIRLLIDIVIKANSAMQQQKTLMIDS